MDETTVKSQVFYPERKWIGFLMLLIFLLVFAAIIFFCLKTLIISPNILNLIVITPGLVIVSIVFFPALIAFFSLPSMRYELRDDALYLIIGPWRDRIPYNEIVDISVKDLVLNPLSSFRFPGLALFNVAYSDEGTVRMYSTHALKDVVLIKTLNKKYGISPKDEEGFINALRSKIETFKDVKTSIPGKSEYTNKEILPKKWSFVEIIVWLIVAASFIVGIYFYPRLPERIAVHWSASGNVNGYLPKFIGIFLIPFSSFILTLIPVLVPSGSKESYINMKIKYYIGILVVLSVLFFAYIYMLLWNIGVKMNFHIFSTILITGIVISIIVQLIVFKKTHPSQDSQYQGKREILH